MDREKVINEFEHLLNAAKGNYQDFVDLTVDGGEEILALLKEQEPIPAIDVAECGWRVDGCRYGKCPKCGKGIMSYHDYCGYCGQEVKWDD